MGPFGTIQSAALTFVLVASLVTFSSQTSSNRFSCVCLPYYNCDTENIVITNGKGLIETRKNGSDNADGEPVCEDVWDVCCRLPETQVKTRNCGFRRSRNPHPFVPRLDKDQADRGEFPWMVTIFETQMAEQNNETTETKVYQCQGTLIHEKVVLTAAQCVQNSSSQLLSIRAGQSDTMTTQEESLYQEHDVKETLVHPNFKPNKLHNNIALLILKTSVLINSNVDIGCLVDHRDIYDEDNCLSIGWDKFLKPEDVFHQKSQSNDLKRRIEPFISTTNCTAILNQTLLGKNYNLHKSFVCARGSARKNFCSREIGGPLVCPLKSDPSQYVQVGISSWCISFGNVPLPSVFANVLHARKWIKTTMAKAGIQSSNNQARNRQTD